MRKEKRWRYYCDYCKKSGASAFHLKEHETHCTMNPSRICRMCGYAKLHQRFIGELVRAVSDGGLSKLEKVANSCPACMLSAIRQSRIDIPEFFDFKGRCKDFLEKVNAENYANEGGEALCSM